MFFFSFENDWYYYNLYWCNGGWHYKTDNNDRIVGDKPVKNEQTILFTVEDADKSWEQLLEFLAEQKCEVKESPKKYKMQGTFMTSEERLVVCLRIESASPEVNCIRVERVAGDKMDFLQTFNELRDVLIDMDAIIV